jgi:protein Tex
VTPTPTVKSDSTFSSGATLRSVTARLAEELAVREAQVAASVRLLDEGATVPFIARYRKEVTGSLDDGQRRDCDTCRG